MPAWIFGWIVGDLVGRIALSRAVMTLVVWYGTVFLGRWLGEANISADAGWYTSVAAPVALLAWTMWRPATSRIKLWLIDGIYLWARLGLVIVAAKAIFRLVRADGRLVEWVVDAWPLALAAAALWGVQRGLVAWIQRSHDRVGDRSVVHV